MDLNSIPHAAEELKNKVEKSWKLVQEYGDNNEKAVWSNLYAIVLMIEIMTLQYAEDQKRQTSDRKQNNRRVRQTVSRHASGKARRSPRFGK